LKKSHVYKSEENIIFSHEKDEEMNKLDDSEFKLPNEDKSRLISVIPPHSLLEAVQKEEVYVNIPRSDLNQEMTIKEEIHCKKRFINF